MNIQRGGKTSYFYFIDTHPAHRNWQ